MKHPVIAAMITLFMAPVAQNSIIDDEFTYNTVGIEKDGQVTTDYNAHSCAQIYVHEGSWHGKDAKNEGFVRLYDEGTKSYVHDLDGRLYDSLGIDLRTSQIIKVRDPRGSVSIKFNRRNGDITIHDKDRGERISMKNLRKID